MMKEKLKKKSFWISVVSAAILVLQFLGIKIDAPYVNEVMSAVCAILVFVGLVKDDTITDESKIDDANVDGSLDVNQSTTDNDEGAED